MAKQPTFDDAETKEWGIILPTMPTRQASALTLRDMEILLGKLLLTVNRQDIQIRRLKQSVKALEAASDERSGEL